MSEVGTVLYASLTLYALATGVYLILENRRPQSTLAWMLAFVLAPGVGVLLYVLFGRNQKAFSKRSKLLRQDFESNARPLLDRLLSRQDAVIAHLEADSASRKKLAMLVRHNSRSALTSRNHVRILQGGAVFYENLMNDIRAAKRSIHLQYFIWAADEFTEALKNLLIDKARAGVVVRLLYDPLGSFGHLTRAYVRSMREAGIHLAPTSPVWHLHTISYRNHRKITVIDGEIGYTGGMNIGKEHLDGGPQFSSWRDTQLRITGEGASALQAVFMVDWYNAVREDLFSPEYFPETVPDPEEEIPVQILTSGPDSEWAAIRQLYFFLVVSAQHHVFLQSPYFIPDATLAEALKSAALAGVQVHVMISARPSGNRFPAWASNTFMNDVADAGVRIHLYEKGYLHAKTISIDSEICSIGSANIDIRSFSINYELNAILYSRKLAARLEEDFARDLADCSAFDSAKYRDGRAAIRFRDSMARLLSPLL